MGSSLTLLSQHRMRYRSFTCLRISTNMSLLQPQHGLDIFECNTQFVKGTRALASALRKMVWQCETIYAMLRSGEDAFSDIEPDNDLYPCTMVLSSL